MVSKYVSNLIPQFYIQFGQLCVKKIEYFWATFQGGCQRIWTKILYDSNAGYNKSVNFFDKMSNKDMYIFRKTYKCYECEGTLT